VSSVNVDIRRERARYLLYLLATGNLPREMAGELRDLLIEELALANKQGDLDHVNRLNALIRMLENYIAGTIDLMIHPEVTVSNIV
jgi:hypothetical protein